MDHAKTITFMSHFENVKGVVVTTNDGICATYLASIDLEHMQKSKRNYIEDNVIHLFPLTIKDKVISQVI